ncbi:MAG: 30S ribosomal protein S16, partial [Pseudomonadota bacterium]
MLIIRLTRHGAKKAPFYHVTVADRAAKRDGRFVERVGFYNPVSKGNAESLRLNLERVDYWVSVGAQPSETVARLISKARKAAAAEAPAAAAEA